jgi:hypothetical protein
MRRLPALLATALLMLSAPSLSQAQSHPLTRYCSDRYVITGTVIGRVQMQRLAGNQITPEMAQTAALWALTVPEKRNQVRFQIQQRMRAQGKWGEVEEVLWPMVANDAATAVQRADLGRQAAKPAVGGVLGGTVGAVLGMATGQNPVTWGAVGAGAGANLPLPTRSPTKALWDIAVGPHLDRALDLLVRNPCTMTAEDALNMVKINP